MSAPGIEFAGSAAIDGMPIFGPNEAAMPDPYGDPIYNGLMDFCLGHTAMGGLYHYHGLLVECLVGDVAPDEPSPIIGFALDGYPIFGPRGSRGKLLSNDDLDACHGQTSRVFYEGRWQRIYHYNATLEYPDTLGCFRGTPSA